jgi:hypothetical protein
VLTLITVVATLLTPLSQSSPQWVLAASNLEGGRYSVDTMRVFKLPGGKLRVFIHHLYPRVQQLSSGGSYSYKISDGEFDCVSKSYRQTYVTLYSPTDRPVVQDERAMDIPVSRGSVLDIIRTTVCQRWGPGTEAQESFGGGDRLDSSSK